MKNRYSLNIEDIDFSQEYINSLIVNKVFSTDLIITKYNLILLFKLVVFFKKYYKDIKINLTIKDIKYFNVDIFNKIKDTNIINKISLDLADLKRDNIKILFTYLQNYKWIILDINFNLSKDNAMLIYIIVSNYLSLKNEINIKFNVLNHNEIRDIYYVFDLIKNKFDWQKKVNYSINNVPYCIFIDRLNKLSNNRYINNEKISSSCKNCSLLSICKWFSDDNLWLFPISFDYKYASKELLNYFWKAITISNLNYDRENKYPIDIDLIKNNFLWDEKKFVKLINDSNKDLSIYIHIPFCISKCNFCCCSSFEWIDLNKKKKYLEKLVLEINTLWGLIYKKNIKNIFFWWWTPSIFDIVDLERIFKAILTNFELNNKTAITFEVTESTLSYEKIDFLKSQWVTNIFMGLQSTDIDILSNVNRKQNIVRFKEYSNYIKSKDITLGIDMIVWLRWDNLVKLKKTLDFIKEINPNSLQVCRFEHFDSLIWEYKKYIPDEKKVEIFFNYARDFLIKVWYKQSSQYDEIFYINKDKLSNYDFDILNSKTDLIWFGAYAKSIIVDKLKFENKPLEWYMESKSDTISLKQSITLLKKDDSKRNNFIANIDCNTYSIDDLRWLSIEKNIFSDFKKLKIIDKIDGSIIFNKNYLNRFSSKVIGTLFFDKKYFEDIYDQLIYNNYIETNINLYQALWKKYDNYDNIYPIDTILDKFSSSDVDNLWKQYLKENKWSKRIDIDKIWIYIHIPFCSSICSFCCCKTWTDLERIDQYLNSLIDEIKKYWKMFRWYKFRTIYFWWWTPWILNNKQIDRVFGEIYKSFKFYDDLFVSFEATPYSLSKSKLLLLKKYWVNRLSIWIQSTNEEVLININRPQKLDYLYKLFNTIKEIGFDFISIDFVAWLKGENIESMKKSIEFIQAIKPDGVHVYQYYIERSNSKEKNSIERAKETEMIFQFAKEKIKEIWYMTLDGNDSVFILKNKKDNNIHDSNLYKYNNSVLPLWEFSEWHIYWKLFYKNINNWDILWKRLDIKAEVWIYVMKNLEFWIDLDYFKNLFWINIFDYFSKEFWYLKYKWVVNIDNWIIKWSFKSHLDYITFYKLFWPHNEILEHLLELFRNNNVDEYDNKEFMNLPVK